MGHQVLSVKNSLKDLGVTFDEKFNFSYHVLSICKSAVSTLGFIRRTSNLLRNPNVIKLLYCSLVRSRLEFGSVIWYPYYAYSADLIENIQRYFSC